MHHQRHHDQESNNSIDDGLHKERRHKKEEEITINSGKCQSSYSDTSLADHAIGAHERLIHYITLLH